MTAPMPGRDNLPSMMHSMLRLGIHLSFVEDDGLALLHQRLAIHDHRLDIPTVAIIDQRFDGIVVRRRRQVIEVNDKDVSLGARGQTAEIWALDEFAAGNSGRVEDILEA